MSLYDLHFQILQTYINNTGGQNLKIQDIWRVDRIGEVNVVCFLTEKEYNKIYISRHCYPVLKTWSKSRRISTQVVIFEQDDSAKVLQNFSCYLIHTPVCLFHHLIFSRLKST